MGNGEGRHGAWELFVASMFIGLGLGMLFDQAGPGIILGMGIGFIASALVGRIERRYVLTIPRSVSSVTLVVLGILFVVGGLGLLDVVKLPLDALRYLGAAAMILFGAGPPQRLPGEKVPVEARAPLDEVDVPEEHP